MDTFKKKVQIRVYVLSLLAIGVILLYIGFMFFRPHLPILNSFAKGFHQGIFLGLELAIIGFLVRNAKALKNDEATKKLYIEEGDERTGLIIKNAASLGTSVAFTGLAVATAVAGFINITVFVTLLSTLLFMLVLFFSLWGYFAKRS